MHNRSNFVCVGKSELIRNQHVTCSSHVAGSKIQNKNSNLLRSPSRRSRGGEHPRSNRRRLLHVTNDTAFYEIHLDVFLAGVRHHFRN
jgi:hypothetical protein